MPSIHFSQISLNISNVYKKHTYSTPPKWHQAKITIDPLNRQHWPASHPSIISINLNVCVCVCVVAENLNPGSMDLERLRPFKHLWGATEPQYGSPSGTNSPWFCTLSPDQWNSSSLHTLFSRTAATDFLPPSSDSQAVHRWGCITLACLRDCVYGGRQGQGVCIAAHLCVVCVCLWCVWCVWNRGFSQWPGLEVIIMYRSVCCNANANAFSVATARVPVLC